MRALALLSITLLITWLAGITSFRLLLLVVVARLVLPAIYGLLAGRKIGEDSHAARKFGD